MGDRVIRGLALVGLFVFVFVSWLTYDAAQWPAPVAWRTLVGTSHPCGPLGLMVAHAITAFFGRVFAILVPLSLMVLGYGALARWNRKQTWWIEARMLGVALLGMALAEFAGGPGAGGRLGGVVLQVLGALVGRTGTLILLACVGGLVLLRIARPLVMPLVLHTDQLRLHAHGFELLTRAALRRLRDDARRLLWNPPSFETESQPDELAPALRRRSVLPGPAPGRQSAPGAAPGTPRIRDVRHAAQPRVIEQSGLPASERDVPTSRLDFDTPYALPALDLLQQRPNNTDQDAADDELLKVSRALEEKLAHFGIGGRVAEVQPGPVITTYEFEPAPGIKVSQVTSRVNDLAMALRAQAIRMVAPIPGKAAIGIEIPNHTAHVVSLRDIMDSWSNDLKVGVLGLALGKTVSGEPFFADLAAMPHLLVAGATGSGKSVCINVILCSLLMRHDPNELKLLLIDPKMLELNAYRDIPHLLHPVVTEPRDAYKALHWMTLEMERRYRELARTGVRNIVGYNNKARAGELRDDDGRSKVALPYVVVIVDELADLMIQVGNEIETPIARLAQMARAVGIHLVLATQRPSVDVITGVIKANFPSRIAFQVPSRIDSRTILDGSGAETLLGRGDMLFLAGGRPAPIRLHGAFVSVEECEGIAAHWRSFGQGAGTLDLDDGRGGAGDDVGLDDELFEVARRLVVTSAIGSVSYLQRRLKVGYSRAARIMDLLEERGVVGPAVGSKPREVFERPEDLPEPAA